MSNRRYTAEFKAEAVKQIIERGYSVQEVSRRLGVSSHSLYKWVKDHTQLTDPSPDQGRLSQLEAENAKLREALERAEEERDILKKATAYFARQSG